MEKKSFGRTGLEVSRLTFGCGAVGGLMTKGTAADQDRAVAWARDHGINHFDTAPAYGNTASETNLGRALGRDREGIVVSTKIGIGEAERADIAGAVRRSLEASLSRLQQDHVDLFQLHNTLAPSGASDAMSADQVLNEVVPAFEKMREEGKTRFLGFTAKGDTGALHRLIESGRFDGAQVFYNLLTPSAGETVPAAFPAQDYRRLLDLAGKNGVGCIVVRILAGGALSGSEARHPLGAQAVAPIGSSQDYATDVARALKFQPVVDAGHAADLAELAIRYVISNPAVPTAEIGIATLAEFQNAYHAVAKGPLAPEALAQIRTIQAGFAAERG